MLNSMASDDLTVFILSDSVGKTAETLVNAVVSQFESERIIIKKFNYITNINKLKRVFDQAKEEDNVIIIYTIVIPELSDYIEVMSKKLDIVTIDVMGPVLNRFSKVIKEEPQLKPGLNHKIDQKYFNRISCIEFAIRCDDGKDLTKLKEADIVLIGVSRTSKTPLSTHLANQGYKVANIPLVPEINPPKELYQIPYNKVVGLIIDIEKLQEIRKERLKTMNFNQEAYYARVDRILEELIFAEEIMKELGCMIIDVTKKSIEETASIILAERRELEISK